MSEITTKLTRRQFVGSAAAALAASSLAPAYARDRKEERRIHVTIRDEILMLGGFPSVGEGLQFAGVNGVEVAVGRDSAVLPIHPEGGKAKLLLNQDDDVKQFEKQLDANKLHVTAFLLHNNFNAPDIDSELAWVVRVVKVAEQLGVPAVRIDAIMKGADQFPVAQRQEIFSRCVNRILADTKGMHVDLGIENHGAQGNNPEFLLGLIKQVNSPRLGVNMDTGNFYWAGYPLDEVYQILEQLAPYAKHTHIKNIKYPAEMRNQRRPVGYQYAKYNCPIPEGDIDHSKLVGYLKKASYRNDLCIEDESLSKFDQATRRTNIRAAVDYLKTLL
jgi:sugar phosphate isomerase/epimerase